MRLHICPSLAITAAAILMMAPGSCRDQPAAPLPPGVKAV